MSVEVRILGLLEAVDGPRPIELRRTKLRTVLAVLVLHANEVVSVEALTEALWNDEPPDSAANTLQGYISQLRKALGADLIHTRSPGYLLNISADAVDALRFERLSKAGREALERGDAAEAAAVFAEALGLWRGQALADFMFDSFAQFEIARLQEMRLVATESLVESELALGRHAELVGRLQVLVEAHPLRERLWHQLVRALYRSGRQAEALRALAEVRRHLGEELGISPGVDIRRLEEDVLQQRPELDWRAASVADIQIPTDLSGTRSKDAGDDRSDRVLSASTFLDVWASGTSTRVLFAGFRLTLGRAEDNDVVIGDRRVSAFHLVFERVGPHWSVRDIGSRNGTVLNGEHLVSEKVLQSGDEILVGGSRLVYRTPAVPMSPTTEGTTAPPLLATRENDVLMALCRPLAEGSLLTEPASIASIAAELVLPESAVKRHTADLYDKFGLYGDDRRPGRLANEAISRGAVPVAELRSPT